MAEVVVAWYPVYAAVEFADDGDWRRVEIEMLAVDAVHGLLASCDNAVFSLGFRRGRRLVGRLVWGFCLGSRCVMRRL